MEEQKGVKRMGEKCGQSEPLVVASKVKAYIKSKGFMTGSDALEAINCEVYCLLDAGEIAVLRLAKDHVGSPICLETPNLGGVGQVETIEVDVVSGQLSTANGLDRRLGVQLPVLRPERVQHDT